MALDAMQRRSGERDEEQGESSWEALARAFARAVWLDRPHGDIVRAMVLKYRAEEAQR